MTQYVCSKCSKTAQVQNGTLVKECACDAPVIANIKATATGESRTRLEQTPNIDCNCGASVMTHLICALQGNPALDCPASKFMTTALSHLHSVTA